MNHMIQLDPVIHILNLVESPFFWGSIEFYKHLIISNEPLAYEISNPIGDLTFKSKEKEI